MAMIQVSLDDLLPLVRDDPGLAPAWGPHGAVPVVGGVKLSAAVEAEASDDDGLVAWPPSCPYDWKKGAGHYKHCKQLT